MNQLFTFKKAVIPFKLLFNFIRECSFQQQNFAIIQLIIVSFVKYQNQTFIIMLSFYSSLVDNVNVRNPSDRNVHMLFVYWYK
jgi:hypothetical protein